MLHKIYLRMKWPSWLPKDNTPIRRYAECNSNFSRLISRFRRMILKYPPLSFKCRTLSYRELQIQGILLLINSLALPQILFQLMSHFQIFQSLIPLFAMTWNWTMQALSLANIPAYKINHRILQFWMQISMPPQPFIWVQTMLFETQATLCPHWLWLPVALPPRCPVWAWSVLVVGLWQCLLILISPSHGSSEASH